MLYTQMLTLIHAYINTYTHKEMQPLQMYSTHKGIQNLRYTLEHMCTLVLTCTLMHIHV